MFRNIRGTKGVSQLRILSIVSDTLILVFSEAMKAFALRAPNTTYQPWPRPQQRIRPIRPFLSEMSRLRKLVSTARSHHQEEVHRRLATHRAHRDSWDDESLISVQRFERMRSKQIRELTLTQESFEDSIALESSKIVRTFFSSALITDDKSCTLT